MTSGVKIPLGLIVNGREPKIGLKNLKKNAKRDYFGRKNVSQKCVAKVCRISETNRQKILK